MTPHEVVGGKIMGQIPLWAGIVYRENQGAKVLAMEE
jgi:hypothetical protein